MATIAHSNRAAVFFGSGPRRADTRFCARRNGDSFSASKSSRRASSSSSRAGPSGVEYNSSWMVDPLLLAINRSVVVGTAEQIHYNFSAVREIEEKWIRFAQGGGTAAGCCLFVTLPLIVTAGRLDHEQPTAKSQQLLLCYHSTPMHPVLLSLLLGSTAAAANVFGGTIIVKRNWDRSYLKYFVALGAGFMLATAILEIIPASFDLREKDAPFLILAGYLITHFFEHTVTPHFHFGEETHADQFVAAHKGYSVLLGLVIHTFFDGIAIASGFIVSNWLGWMIFLAIFLHKIPEGFTIASVMLASGRSRRLAWGASVLLGAATFAGVLTMAIFQRHVGIGLPLSGGVTIYVAASDLMPEVNREPGGKMALVVLLGVAIFFLLDRLLH